MGDVALLDLAKRIIYLHQTNDREKDVLSLPVVHDSIDMDHDALAAIVSRYDGVYMRCDDADQQPAPRGPINVTIAQHVIHLCAQRGLKIEFSMSDGRVIAVAPEYGEPTGSLPMVLRILATLASAELDAPLAVVSYSLQGLDEVRAPLIWDAMQAPIHFPPPTLRTFVPIAGGDVDVVNHCARAEGSVRLVVRDGEMIERGTARLLADSFPMILTNVDQPLVLFLGAGASASCNMPQGNRLRDQALALLVRKSAGSSDLVPAFRQWLSDHNRWMQEERELPLEMFERNLTLERVLREEFHVLSGRPRSQSHTVQRIQRDCALALDRQPEGRKALWRLAELLPRLVIATVNFDQLIEIGMSAKNAVIIGSQEFGKNRDLIAARLKGESDTIPILKLHGSIEEVDSLVADINTTSRGLPTDVSATLDSMLREAPYLSWVWVGCSMRDADLGAWLGSKSGGPGGDLQEWWVDPLPPKSVLLYAQRYRLKEWAEMDQDLHARQITETSDRFFGSLAAYAAEMLA